MLLKTFIMKKSTIIIGIVILVFGIWYFTRKSKTGSSVQALYIGPNIQVVMAAQYVNIVKKGQIIKGTLNSDGSLAFQYIGNMGVIETQTIPATDFQVVIK
jgi:hypothetical protein